MTPRIPGWLLVIASALCLTLGFLAGLARKETAPQRASSDTTPAEVQAGNDNNMASIRAVSPEQVPDDRPIIHLARLDVHPDEVLPPADPDNHGHAAMEESSLPSLTAPRMESPSFITEPYPGMPDADLSPLCPRANLLQPVPVLPSWIADMTVSRRHGGGMRDGGFVPRVIPLQPRPSSLRLACQPEVLPFTGTYPCLMGGDGVVTLPRAVIEQLEDPQLRVLYLTPGPDGCLWLCTPCGLDRLACPCDLGAPQGDLNLQARQRLVFAQAERCRLGQEGRIAIPEHLVRFADLDGELAIIGVGDHFEVWNAAAWRDYVDFQVEQSRPGQGSMGPDQEEAEIDE